jgi:hypothetical protein
MLSPLLSTNSTLRKKEVDGEEKMHIDDYIFPLLPTFGAAFQVKRVENITKIPSAIMKNGMIQKSKKKAAEILIILIAAEDWSKIASIFEGE